MQYLPLDHPFWGQDCRGPALAHKHGEHVGATGGHDDCPCRDCGLTPARWAKMVRLNETDDTPLQLPQQGEPGFVPQEKQYTWPARVNKYKDWVPGQQTWIASSMGMPQDPFNGQYVDGDPRGPGRGDLSPAWVEWALNARWVR